MSDRDADPDPDAPCPTDDGTVRPGSRRRALLRVLLLVAVVAAVSVTVQASGWNGPQQLQDLVAAAGWAGVVVFVVGYAVLVLVPSPASVLTILAGALFGLWWGTLLAWLGALLGSFGGYVIGRFLARGSVDRLLRGRLAQVDALLVRHGLLAVLVVRLVPVFPFTPVNYAAGAVGVGLRPYVLGTAAGILPGALAYAAVGASGADPLGIVVGAGALVALTLLGGTLARRHLRTAPGTPRDGQPPSAR